MGGFAEALVERVRAARVGLETALEAGDAYEVAVAQDELDDAVRMARANGIHAEADTAVKEDEG